MRTLRRFAAYLRPYPGLLTLLFVTMLGGIAAELILPRLFGMAIDRGITERSVAALGRYIGYLALTAILRAGIHYGRGYSQERTGQEMIRVLRRELYVRLQRLSFTFYTMNNTGDLMSRLTSDVGAVMEFFGFGLAEMVASVLIFCGTVVMLLLADWQLTLVMIAPIPVLMFFAFRFSGVVGPAWEKIREEMGRLTTALQENVSGVRVVKAFAREGYEIDKFKAHNARTLQANLTRATLEAQTFPVLNFVTGFCLLLLYWYGGRRVYAGEMTIGTFFAFNWYLFGLIWPVRFLGYLTSIAKEAIAAGPRIFEILDATQKIREAEDAQPMPEIKGHIRFEDVHFTFEDDKTTPVLKGLNACCELDS